MILLAAGFLSCKLKEAFVLQDQKIAVYDVLTRVAGEHVKVWEEMEAYQGWACAAVGIETCIAALSKGRGRWKHGSKSRSTAGAFRSVYMLDKDKGRAFQLLSDYTVPHQPLVPNAGKAYEELAALEIQPDSTFTMAAADKVPLGTTNYFCMALAIEQRQ